MAENPCHDVPAPVAPSAPRASSPILRLIAATIGARSCPPLGAALADPLRRRAAQGAGGTLDVSIVELPPLSVAAQWPPRWSCVAIALMADDEHALAHRKQCSLCGVPRDVLVRCQVDESRRWCFVCPGKCWRGVSGGAVDGDAGHPGYRYGGMWKNKHAGVSAKIKGSAKAKGRGEMVDVTGGGGRDGGDGAEAKGDSTVRGAETGKGKKSKASRKQEETAEDILKAWDEAGQDQV